MRKSPFVSTSCAFLICALVGCAGAKQAQANVPRIGPGTLMLTVNYSDPCQDSRGNDSCLSIEYPEVCWKGACSGECGADGAHEFRICAPGGKRTDNPMHLEQTVAQHGLSAGKWAVVAQSPDWTVDCNTVLAAGQTHATTIDTAIQRCH